MREHFRRHGRELALVAGVCIILAVLFAPIPPMALDLAILTNFGLGLTILLLTLYVQKPVEFSTFPSLLLISTLFRLALNVAATRLILTSGAAGDVINSIGSFAVGGNFVVGLVVFLILIVVQYVVVTAGAQRVSEVAARFVLDSIPGQQMSIDADLNMGLIDQKEALRRRAALEKEASFYGAMDGASKFVKGDAIAGVIILLINVIAGWIIGVMQMGMNWQEALHRFTLLTIGDGIATQLPALIISIATGIIVTRSSADKELSTEVFRQLSSVPRILLIVTGILCLLLFLPGMPKWPIAILAGGALLGWLKLRGTTREAPDDAEATDVVGKADSPAQAQIVIAMGPSLGAAWRDSEAILMERITTLRDAQETSLGVGFPHVKIVDGPQLAPREYEVRILGSRHASGEIEPEQTLAIKSEKVKRRIDGLDTVDPAFGLPAVWIDNSRVREAREAGYTIVDPVTVFITHLGEALRTACPSLLTRSTTVRLIEGVRARQPGLVEELVPNQLSVSDIQRVLQTLLSESVSIASLELIIEHLVDLSRTEKEVGQLTELLRQRLAPVICDRLMGRHRDLAVISLDPRLENQIQASVLAGGKRDSLAIDPRLAEKLIRRLVTLSGEMIRQGREPVLLCGPDIRRSLRAITRRSISKMSIISINEIPTTIELRSHAIANVDGLETTTRNETIMSEVQHA